MKLNGNNTVITKNDKKVTHHAKFENPLHDDAFSIDNTTKIELIKNRFEEILHIIGLDLTDDSLKDTPHRIAKMYINEIFSGINPNNKPKITLFKNKYEYHTPLIELNIPFTSFCEHHFVPITGKANVAYIPKDYVIGLSKIHRLIDYYARRPQVQERLTQQIIKDLSDTLQTNDVGLAMKASHSCISCRGVEDFGSSTITSGFLGQIANNKAVVSLLLES
jgi:GTP cyclohydrolase I